jgi:hypothetical protein
VANKLDEQRKTGAPFKLAPHEWKCGKNQRIIDAIDSKNAVTQLLAKLTPL